MMKGKDKTIMKYIVLPLFGVRSKFVENDFISAYLNKDLNKLFLQTEYSHDFNDLPNFTGMITYADKKFFVFESISNFSKDLKLIVQGKYSKLSDNAKSVIRSLSGLKYKVLNPATGKERTADILLALDKSPAYRAAIEARIGMKLKDSDELYSKLSDEIFIDNLELLK